MIQPSVYAPKIELFLVKNINREDIDTGIPVSQRYAGIPIGARDLSGFLGDQGGVRISKGVSDPAGGFSITFTDRPHETLLDSLYGLIEPMDMILICMAHDPSEYPHKIGHSRLPIVMRGLVSEVSRNESIGGDGRPQRHVVVTGQDHGKILQILQVIYLNHSMLGDNILHEFKFMHKYGVDYSKNPTIKEFVDGVVDRVIGPFVSAISGIAVDSTLAWINADVTAQGRISYRVVNAWPGGQGIHHLLTHACDVDSGFNEMFIDDRPDGVYLVLRPKPWRNPAGAYIQTDYDKEDGPKVETVDITGDDVLSMSASRSDQGVANLFWVMAPQDSLPSDDLMRLSAQVAPSTHINCDIRKYGIRQMQTTTNLAGGNFGDRDTAEKRRVSDGEALAWMKDRVDLLERASRDAVVFESGSMKLKGNERIRAGMFVRLTRGETVSRYYVNRVDHDFVPFHSYTTTIHFERGTGFIARAQKLSPYESEGVK